jgi:hypothetical protein
MVFSLIFLTLMKHYNIIHFDDFSFTAAKKVCLMNEVLMMKWIIVISMWLMINVMMMVVVNLMKWFENNNV